MDLGELTLEKALALVGTNFEVTLPDGATTNMKLDEALTLDVRQRRRTRGAPVPKREPFSLYFLGDPKVLLPQGTYDFRSEAVQFENLFIVPIGQDEEGTEYEAVFT